MTNTETLVRKLKSEPNVALIIARVQKDLQAEKMKRQEFYDLIHENIKAEFINGEIIMHSPTMRKHWKTSMNLSRAMSNYVYQNQLGEVGVEKVMLNFTRNDYEPDIVFFSKEKSKDFHDDQLLFPAPNLVVEILSESTKKRDRGIKFVDYAAHGVLEYWIVDPTKKCIEQYYLQNGEFILLGIFYDILSTETIKGFVIDLKSVFD